MVNRFKQSNKHSDVERMALESQPVQSSHFTDEVTAIQKGRWPAQCQ